MNGIKTTAKLTPTALAYWRTAGSVLLAAHIAGCTINPASQLERMRAHPEYADAMMAAPDFTTDALKTIADLESRKSK